jgi:hypothetical protein
MTFHECVAADFRSLRGATAVRFGADISQQLDNTSHDAKCRSAVRAGDE